MKIIVLTGGEIRHQFFRKKIASDPRISVLTTHCESTEKSLENRIKLNKESSKLELQHVQARTQAEKDFDSKACHKLYQKFYAGLIEKFLISRDHKKFSYIVENRGINK